MNERILSLRPSFLLFRQSEDVQRVAACRIVNIGQDCARYISWAAAAEACGDGDVLFASDAERYGKTLHRCAEAGLPQHFAGVDVNGAEDAVEIADKCDAASG